jgi:myo-inositol-1(or 4)-monophosphatase
MDPEHLAEIARRSARLAAQTHRRREGELQVSEWDQKGTADYVTRVDREAEEYAVGHIRDCCPGHDIMAEESTDLGDPSSVRARFEASEFLWIIDPLDGTTNYLHGYRTYAASVAVARRGELVAGAVVDGSAGTEWWAWKGGGAWRDGDRIAVSQIDRLDRALIGTGFPFKVTQLLPRYLRQLDAVLRVTSGVRRAGAAALDLCHVADGRLDGFWELWLAPWDIGAGVVIVREAGGVVTSVDGHPDVRAAGAICAGNPAIHPALLNVVQQV